MINYYAYLKKEEKQNFLSTLKKCNKKSLKKVNIIDDDLFNTNDNHYGDISCIILTDNSLSNVKIDEMWSLDKFNTFHEISINEMSQLIINRYNYKENDKYD